MSTLTEWHEREEAASRDLAFDRWLAVSEPLAIDDDDPSWSESPFDHLDDVREHEYLAA
jgi:hypothetical protein